MSKILILIVFFNFNSLAMDFFEDSSKTLYPMNQKTLEKYIPTLPRLLDDNELKEKAKQEAFAKEKAQKAAKQQQEKIDKTFTDKTTLENSTQQQEKVHTTNKNVSFFDKQIENQDEKPVNLE